jgi:F-type H+-transporting ATPase subunit delta
MSYSVYSTVATPYAKALLAAASKGNALEAASAGAAYLQDVWQKTPQLARFLSNKLVDKNDKKSILDTWAAHGQLHSTLINLLAAISDTGRFAALPEILRQFQALSLAQQGYTQVQVETASALPNAAQQELESALKKQLGDKVTVQHAVKPHLIAGMRVMVGAMLYDASYRTKLNQVRQALTANIA